MLKNNNFRNINFFIKISYLILYNIYNIFLFTKCMKQNHLSINILPLNSSNINKNNIKKFK